MVFSGSGAGETIVGQLRGIEVVFGRISGATLVVVAVGTGARCEICAHPHLSSRMAKEGALLFVFASPFFPLRSRSFISLSRAHPFCHIRVYSFLSLLLPSWFVLMF